MSNWRESLKELKPFNPTKTSTEADLSFEGFEGMAPSKLTPLRALPYQKGVSFEGFEGFDSSFEGFEGGSTKFAFLNPTYLLLKRKNPLPVGGNPVENQKNNTTGKTFKTFKTFKTDDQSQESCPLPKFPPLDFNPDALPLCEQEARRREAREVQARESAQAAAQDLEQKRNQWETLALSGKTDMDASGVDDALFLFGLRSIQQSGHADLPGIWERFSKYWKRRMPIQAFKVIEDEYKRRIKTNQPAAERAQQMRVVNR